MSSIAGTKHSIAVSSGTAALHTIMASIVSKPGTEVIVPANTFVSTANAALYIGARVRLADCDPFSFNVTRDTIDKCITPKTGGVIVTHIGGNPCDMDDIIRLCRDRGIFLVEDVAHALGSSYKGKACGSFGIANAFSFYPTKVVTSAEGGVITTNSRPIDTFSRTFRNVGRRAYGHGPITLLGYNYRMSDVHAVIGLNQLGHLEEFVERRNALAKIYDERIQKISWLRPQRVSKQSVSSYYTYMVSVVGRVQSRDALMRQLEKKGIETTVMFKPVHLQPYSKGRIETPDGLPNAERVGTTSLVLPMHAALRDEQIEYVCDALRDAGRR